MIIRNSRDLGALVRDHRVKKGLTQAQLATRVGVSRKWLIDLESGKRTSDLRLVLRTVNAIGLQLDAVDKPKQGVIGGPDINAIVNATQTDAYKK